MRHEFSIPGYTTLAGVSYETHETDCAVELEPDEDQGLADFYIARCFIQVHVKRKWVWVEVKRTEPLFKTIRDWALQEYRVALNDLWTDYLEDVPARKRPPYDENQEHGTWR